MPVQFREPNKFILPRCHVGPSKTRHFVQIVRFLPKILARTLPFVLTEIYIEALLVDKELADLVWEAWGAGIACPRSNLIGNDAYIPQFPDPVRHDFIRE